MLSRRRRAWMPALVGVALLAGGCGADSDPKAAAVEVIEPAGGGVLRLGVVGEVVVDPTAATVGDACNGAVTHPGGKAETHVYADI